MFVPKIEPRQYDTAREDPFGDFNGNGRINTGPPVESQKIDGREGIHTVDGA